MARPSIITADFAGALPAQTRLLFGLWHGYRLKQEWEQAEKQLMAVQGEIIPCHASGHAHEAALFRYIRRLQPRMIHPVHTTASYEDFLAKRGQQWLHLLTIPARSQPPPPMTEPKDHLLSGFKDIINAVLTTEPSKSHKFCSIGASKRICSASPPAYDLVGLVEDLWRQLAANWIEGGAQWRGGENWRWKPLGTRTAGNPSSEISLQRTWIDRLTSGRWSNETPTASGLGLKPTTETVGWGEPGGLDLAYEHASGEVSMIELKTSQGSGAPVDAAFQIVSYALVLILARHVHHLFSVGREPVELAPQWDHATCFHLRVLAPTEYFDGHLDGINLFEQRLSEAVAAFACRLHPRLRLDFAFRRFDPSLRDDPQPEPKLVEALEHGLVGVR